ncbi:hypothetical protein Slin14017_G118310 [Septoria linicola]|nr:hypothetical protein Slin14017_G118310 [Septoria linicola]
MDAISALGVAAATVQFLDFSFQALHLCRQIRDDVTGATAANAQLDEYARDVPNAAEDLKKASSTKSPTARQIAKVAQQCVITADELLVVLERVRRAGQSSFLNDVKATFRVMKDRRTIEKLQNALKTHQVRLDSAVNHDVRARVGFAGITQSRQFESLEKKMQQLALSLEEQQVILQEQQLTRLSHHSVLQERFAAAERQTGHVAVSLAANHQSTMLQLAGLHDNLNSGFDRITVDDARAKFLGGLFFPELRLRQETFAAPASQTCEWIFRTTSSNHLADFEAWLETRAGIFWISGKAGSGKSTLMAYGCIFVDGLDKQMGDGSDLLRLLNTLLVSENIKACVSSRPEAQLAKALSERPHTQMEICNRPDIEDYVFKRFAKLPKYLSFARAIVDQAQGVFLWAVLVTRSILVGIESGDDESLLRLRLVDSPAEMTALIQHMARKINFIYTRTLGAYFSIPRCHRIGIGDEPTLALIAASNVPREIVSYKAFMAECKRRQLRISAQSGGLLEVKDEGSFVKQNTSPVWSLSHDLRSADADGMLNITRRDLAASRSLTNADNLVYALQTTEATTVAWLHRSVHDLFFDPDTNALSTKLKFQPMRGTIMMLLRARIKLLVSAPSDQLPLLTAPTRVVDMVETAIQARAQIGDDIQIILGELANTTGHFSRDELEFRGIQRSILGDLIYFSAEIDQNVYAKTMLYMICMELGELDYIQTGIDSLFRGTNSCWIVARLILDAVRPALRRIPLCVSAVALPRLLPVRVAGLSTCYYICCVL